MAILRTDIERALDELISHEDWGRFQGLAVVLGKQRWPELIAHPRKRDFGLDAYAPAGLATQNYDKGLAASITATLSKVAEDAGKAKKNFPDLGALLFFTPRVVGNSERRKWEATIRQEHGLELYVIEREEIVTLMMMPKNASLCASFLHLDIDVEPEISDLIDGTRQAAAEVVQTWAEKTKGHPLIDLSAVRLDANSATSADLLSLEQVEQVLSNSGRIIIEGPAGRGKTTTLIQLARRANVASIPFIVELSAWTSSSLGILQYIAGMPGFQSEGLTSADLARVHQNVPFLFLLNGWNEIEESGSNRANVSLRELERNFPRAGIVVATRTHHLTPPLPGAQRLRLQRLRRQQRDSYLVARLGDPHAELCARIDADPSLDELTRSPFILSEVCSLFEAGTEIPSKKLGVLAQVVRLQERRDEHRNFLQAAPLFGLQSKYMKALAIEMTRRGAVALSEMDARAVIAATTQCLVSRGEVQEAGAPTVLSSLTAHHILERVEYPNAAFRFEHQQYQEYYAALYVRGLLLDLDDANHDAVDRFIAEFVNVPAWAEPLRMIAETLAEQSSGLGTDARYIGAGARLVQMALKVDLVFAGELAQLCGATVWNDVREVLGQRFRTVYGLSGRHFRQYAIAAMLATGSSDFRDIIVPLLSSRDQQSRLSTYRLWPDFQLSSLGPNWLDEVRGWTEDARTDFVSELLDHHVDDEIAIFAAKDMSVAVKKAAVSSLLWTGPDDSLVGVLESMDDETFEDYARSNVDRTPPALRSKAIAAVRHFVESSGNDPARLRSALDLIQLGATGLDGVVKEELATIPGRELRNLRLNFVRPALEYLRMRDPAWTSEWVAIQTADGTLYRPEEWLPFATAVSEDLVEKCLHRLETEDFRNSRFDGLVAVIAAQADSMLAARVFSKLRELRRSVEANSNQRGTFEWQGIRQLEALFRRLPDDCVAAGVLSCVTSGKLLDIKVAAHLIAGRVAMPYVEPLQIIDDGVRERLRAYLKGSVSIVLRQDDFDGDEKANLALSIAQVGESEDLADLVTLIKADIERMRRGRAALAAGERGPLANGGRMLNAGRYIAAVMRLDPTGAAQVLIDLLPEPEYSRDVADAMSRDFVPKPKHPFGQRFRYDLMWAARDGHTPASDDEEKRILFATALKAEVSRLRMQKQVSDHPTNVKQLARALAAIDGRDSAAVVLDEIATCDQWNEYACLDAAERLLMVGVVLPASVTFALVDHIVARTRTWMQDADRVLLCRILALCAFVDNTTAGIAKIRDVLIDRGLVGYHELRELITALGHSRSENAADFLYQLASNAQTFERYEENIVNAASALDTRRARKLLLGLVDPDITAVTLSRRLNREDVLVARLAELCQRSPEVAERLRALCQHDLPELNRDVVSKVLGRLGTPEALIANLYLIDDAKSAPVPQGLLDQIENSFVESRPVGQERDVFTLHARASNDLRARLFRMVLKDSKRRTSAFMLLGQIEVWRIEYGRPTGEPRHPSLASGRSWPPQMP